MINTQLENQAFSYGSFIWWFGVVENREDPLELGRLQVRIIGYHSSNLADIPSEHLQWAYPMQSINSAAMNGIGMSPTGIVEGATVLGFFRDGSNAQDPVILGSFGGIPKTESDSNQGFNDPNGKYPKQEFLNEPDTNRLARGVEADTSIETQKNSEDKGVAVAMGETWDEKSTEYGAEYPYNHVRETESGHVKEYDDTEGKERIRESHRTGTFYEIHPDGTKVTRIVGDDYQIVSGDGFVHVKGNVNITVDGNSNIYTKGNTNQLIDGNYTLHVGGNMETVVGGTSNETSGGRMYKNAPRIDLN